MKETIRREPALTFDRWAQVPLVVFAAAMVATSVLDAHWSITLGLTIVAFAWFSLRGKVRLTPLEYLAIGLAFGGVLALKFGNVGAETQRWLNWGLSGILTALVLRAAWGLIAAAVAAITEVRALRKELEPVERR